MRGAKVSNIANHRAHAKRDAAGRRIPAVRDPDIATTLHRAQPHRRSSRPSDGILKSRRLYPGASKEGCLKKITVIRCTSEFYLGTLRCLRSSTSANVGDATGLATNMASQTCSTCATSYYVCASGQGQAAALLVGRANIMPTADRSRAHL
jgi:hypothetical protein